MKKLFPWLAASALLYWWFTRRQQITALTPEQLAYQRDLSETQL